MSPKSKALNSYIADIKARNKEFDAMSPAGKRVQIAKDVIQLTKLGFLTITAGTYFRTNPVEGCELLGWDYGDGTEAPKRGPSYRGDEDAREVLASDDVISCNVCGKGAAVVAAIMCRNSELLEEVDGDDCPMEFEFGQFQLIEAFFEGYILEEDDADSIGNYSIVDRDGDAVPTSQIGQAWRCLEENKDDQVRLLTIFENIAANNGDFDPTKLKGVVPMEDAGY